MTKKARFEKFFEVVLDNGTYTVLVDKGSGVVYFSHNVYGTITPVLNSTGTPATYAAWRTTFKGIGDEFLPEPTKVIYQ